MARWPQRRLPERAALSHVSKQVAPEEHLLRDAGLGEQPGSSRSHPGYISKEVFVATR